MSYEFITREEKSGERTVYRDYIICSGCRFPIGHQPLGDWAAYDHPGTLVDTGRHDDKGQAITMLVDPSEDHDALCAECYIKAFKLRYPDAVPPVLYDGRVPGSQAVPIRGL